MRSERIVLATLAFALAVAPIACSKNGQDATSSTTTTTSTYQVSGVQLGRGYSAGAGISEPTQTFKPNEPIYATVITSGSGTGAMLKTRWISDNGKVVREDTQALPADANPTAGIQIMTPQGLPPGHYHLEVSVNDQPPTTTDFVVNAAGSPGSEAVTDTSKVGD